MIITDDTENSGYIFTFTLNSYKKRTVGGLPNILNQTYWTLKGDLSVCPDCGEAHSAEFVGATPLPAPTVDANGDGVIDYSDLTVEDVLGWVSTILATDLHPFERIIKQVDALHVDTIDVASGEAPWTPSP
jgi:hypothetical protein